MRIRQVIAVSLLLLTGLAPSVSAETEYFAVFMEGKKVGHAVRSRTVADGQVTTGEDVSITVSRLGIALTVRMKEISVETPEGKPLSFEVTQELGAFGSMGIRGTVDSSGKVSVVSTSAGTEQSSSLQWPEGAVMAEGLRLLTEKHGLKEGTRYSAKLFSPGVMQAVDTDVVIGSKQKVDLLGRIVELTEVKTVMALPGAGRMMSTGYVDDDLRTLKSIMPIAGMEVEMLSCAKEFALGKNDVLDLIEKMFVRSPQPIRDLPSVTSASYVLRPSPGVEVIVPQSDNQSAKKQADGSILVVVKPLKAPTGARLPYRGADAKLRKATEPNPYLQSDHPDVQRLARQAIGQTKDAAEAASKIEAFVAKFMTNKGLSVGYATAAEVASSREGDCSEFAVLTAAMCRAVGIPAQVVVGIAYVEDFAGLQGFGGHAWTQAYIGDRWVGLDAAFQSAGLGGYDAGHIAFAAGDGEPGAFFNMATALGQFKIESVKLDRSK